LKVFGNIGLADIGRKLAVDVVFDIADFADLPDVEIVFIGQETNLK